jgi:hypothetical protein
VKFACANCGKEADRPTGEVNRARKKGLNLYCGQTCSGLGRRKHKSVEQKKEDKRLYDIEYRQRNATRIRKKKARYFQRTYDPEKARIERKRRAKFHAEYCRRPEYREWKQRYDRKYRAVKEYGEFWECFLLSQDIRDEALNRSTDYEIRLGKARVAACQQRKRHHARSYSKKSEIGPMGDLKQGQRR